MTARKAISHLLRSRLGRPALGLLALVFLVARVFAQSGTPQSGSDNNIVDNPPVTLLPHSDSSRYWISGQDNVIFQWHPSFPAKYSGPNSLRPKAENATSNVATLYLGYTLTHNTEVFADFETADGGGLSDALGLAGFSNVDVVRNPTLGPAPYLARLMIRQIIPLSQEYLEAERDQFSLATRLPVRRLELRFGKLGVADFFDVNDVGGDSHSQFMNWTAVNNGAYDYAADTRGYTVGLIAEYDDHGWAFRVGEMLMPKVANGIDLQWNLRQARAENFEMEMHPHLLRDRKSSVRLLSFVNHANMGVYRAAVENFLDGVTSTPDITAHGFQTTVKYGFGVNLEQDLPHDLRAFARWGWNEGQHESFAYTEVDETMETGADLAGNRWRRKQDKLGAAFISNGISADHQHYLELGGSGFLLGDGALNYGREIIIESYYNAHIWRGIFGGLDLQSVTHPGYNKDRGPVIIPGFRFHLEL
ncbi:MAG TPA: carbohydrate porin [Terriglobales bacterium]|nr:carbohydrate porin [Terriglobales bacterium]